MDARENFKRGAQYDKAWKLAYTLRDDYDDLDDEDRVMVVTTMPPQGWDDLRRRAERKFGVIRPTQSKDADCTVSNEVKEIVRGIFGTLVSSAERGEDVFANS